MLGHKRSAAPQLSHPERAVFSCVRETFSRAPGSSTLVWAGKQFPGVARMPASRREAYGLCVVAVGIHKTEFTGAGWGEIPGVCFIVGLVKEMVPDLYKSMFVFIPQGSGCMGRREAVVNQGTVVYDIEPVTISQARSDCA